MDEINKILGSNINPKMRSTILRELEVVSKTLRTRKKQD